MVIKNGCVCDSGGVKHAERFKIATVREKNETEFAWYLLYYYWYLLIHYSTYCYVLVENLCDWSAGVLCFGFPPLFPAITE